MINRKEKVRTTLTFDKDFFQVMERRAKNSYVSTATWIRQFLMKNLKTKNNLKDNSMEENDK